MAWGRYALLDAECEKLVELLTQHALLGTLLARDPDLCHPDMFRCHGEYGLWVESVYAMLVEYDLTIPQPVISQIHALADRMEIRGIRIP